MEEEQKEEKQVAFLQLHTRGKPSKPLGRSILTPSPEHWIMWNETQILLSHVHSAGQAA